MKTIMWLAAVLAVGTLIAAGTLGGLYVATSNGGDEAIRVTPSRRYKPPTVEPETPPIAELKDCIVVAKARGYDISALQSLMPDPDSATRADIQRLLDVCERIIGR